MYIIYNSHKRNYAMLNVFSVTNPLFHSFSRNLTSPDLPIMTVVVVLVP